MERTEKLIAVKGPLLLFDGVCNLCNGYVQFVIKRDPAEKFVFAPLQSVLAQEIIETHDYSGEKLNSVLLYKNGKLYSQSDVPLEVAGDLKGLWPIFTIFKVVPKFIRNAIYNWIAANRYNWFGKQDQCMIPTPELRARFLS